MPTQSINKKVIRSLCALRIHPLVAVALVAFSASVIGAIFLHNAFAAFRGPTRSPNDPIPDYAIVGNPTAGISDEKIPDTVFTGSADTLVEGQYAIYRALQDLLSGQQQTTVQVLGTGPIALTEKYYSGYMGGFAGADQKCQAEFGANWALCRAATDISNAAHGASPIQGYAISGCDDAGGAGINWCSSEGSKPFTTVSVSGGTTSTASGECGEFRQLLCCSYKQLPANTTQICADSPAKVVANSYYAANGRMYKMTDGNYVFISVDGSQQQIRAIVFDPQGQFVKQFAKPSPQPYQYPQATAFNGTEALFVYAVDSSPVANIKGYTVNIATEAVSSLFNLYSYNSGAPASYSLKATDSMLATYNADGSGYVYFEEIEMDDDGSSDNWKFSALAFNASKQPMQVANTGNAYTYYRGYFYGENYYEKINLTAVERIGAYHVIGHIYDDSQGTCFGTPCDNRSYSITVIPDGWFVNATVPVKGTHQVLYDDNSYLLYTTLVSLPSEVVALAISHDSTSSHTYHKRRVEIRGIDSAGNLIHSKYAYNLSESPYIPADLGGFAVGNTNDLRFIKVNTYSTFPSYIYRVNTLIRQIPSPLWDYTEIPGPPPPGGEGDLNREITWDNGPNANYIYERTNRYLWVLGAAWTGTQYIVLVAEESSQFSGITNVTLLAILVP